MAMEHLLGVALAGAHEELARVEGEAERVRLDAVSTSNRPAL